MGRRVGEFTDPATGEKDWLDVDTISQVVLLQENTVQLGTSRSAAFKFRLGNDNALKMVTLVAEYEYDNGSLTSAAQYIDENAFAEKLAECVYSDLSIDTAEIVVEAKRKAMNDILDKMLERGIIVSNMLWKGIGFIEANGKKVATIENMYIANVNNNMATVELIDCFALAEVKNLIDPVVNFYYQDYKVAIDRFQLKEDSAGRIRKITIDTNAVNVQKINEPEVSYDKIELNIDNEDSLDNFISNRRAMLDNCLSGDSFDDRFADFL